MPPRAAVYLERRFPITDSRTMYTIVKSFGAGQCQAIRVGFLIVVGLLATTGHYAMACIATEGNALLAFKAGITSDPTGILLEWNASTDCCDWPHIVCGKDGHATSLDVHPDPLSDDPSIYLRGTISPSLAKLTHLTRLDLSSMKNLTGSLPSAFGILKNLTYFDVRSNKLTGPIPTSYGGLINLTWLSLGDNMFTGSIPSSIGNIGSTLKFFYLGGCQLSGTIPSSLYKLTGLLALFLNGNRLTGGISPLIGQLNGNLTILDFSNNSLTGYAPSAIGNLKQLHSLNLSYNKLTGSLPQSLGNLTELCVLTLDDNQFSGNIPEVLATNLKKLIYLDLSNNKLTGPIPQDTPFSSFPVSSFDSNAGLCGNPLPPCQS